MASSSKEVAPVTAGSRRSARSSSAASRTWPTWTARMIPSRSTRKVCGGPSTFHAAPIAAVGVGHGRPRRALLGDEGASRIGVVLVERADDDEAAAGVALDGCLEERELLAARSAPACPEVDDDGRPLLRREIECGAVERRPARAGAGLPTRGEPMVTTLAPGLPAGVAPPQAARWRRPEQAERERGGATDRSGHRACILERSRDLAGAPCGHAGRARPCRGRLCAAATPPARRAADLGWRRRAADLGRRPAEAAPGVCREGLARTLAGHEGRRTRPEGPRGVRPMPGRHTRTPGRAEIARQGPRYTFPEYGGA